MFFWPCAPCPCWSNMSKYSPPSSTCQHRAREPLVWQDRSGGDRTHLNSHHRHIADRRIQQPFFFVIAHKRIKTQRYNNKYLIYSPVKQQTDRTRIIIIYTVLLLKGTYEILLKNYFAISYDCDSYTRLYFYSSRGRDRRKRRRQR